MRFLKFLLVPVAAFAQTAESDQRTLQALLSEVQQLRAAIERSTLLGVRTQLAISQLQLQETKVEKLSRDLTSVRELGIRNSLERTNFTEAIKHTENRRSLATDPKTRDQLDQELNHIKLRLEQIAQEEPTRAAREGDLASQLQAAERALADSRNSIAEMQRSLDAAIQQMLKPR